MRMLSGLFVFLNLFFLNLKGQNDTVSTHEEKIKDSVVVKNFPDSSLTAIYRNHHLSRIEVNYHNPGQRDWDTKTTYYENDSVTCIILVNRRYWGKKLDYGQRRWQRTDEAIYRNGKWTMKKGRWHHGPNYM